MAPQKVADAANSGPYLTHLVTHHGQLTLFPPDNAGRIRQPMKQRNRKPERNVRQEEDMRFNTGPKFGKITPTSSRTAERRHRAQRTNTSRAERQNNFVDDEIPDYPPPSFDEATGLSSPPVSFTSSTATYTANHTRPSVTIPSPLGTAPPSVPAPQPEPTIPASTHETSSDSDSDDTYSIIHNQESPVDTASSLSSLPAERGRSPSRSRVALNDLDPDDCPLTPTTPTGSNQSRRRQLSLSPLSLFTHKSSSAPQRALSAHPYSHRNPSFFTRSTTSLATLAFGRSPSSPTSSTSDSKGDRLKGKEKSTEPLDSWEMVERSISRPPSTIAPSRPGSPSPGLESPCPPVHHNQHRPKPVALIDKKTPFPVMKKEAKPRRGSAPAVSVPHPNMAPPLTTTNSGPVITTVRTRRPEPLPPQAISGPSLDIITPESSASMLQKAIETPLPLTPIEKAHADLPSREHTSFVPQLTTATGLDGSVSLANACADDTVIGQSRSPSPESCTCRHAASPNIPSQDISGSHIASSASRPIMPLINTSRTISSVPFTPSTASSSMTLSTYSPSHTPTQSHFDPHPDRHHYSGRPLPRPPPAIGAPSIRTMVDSTYAPSNIQSPACSPSPSTSSTFCPEGLLIDFGESMEESDSLSGSPSSATPRVSLLLSTDTPIDTARTRVSSTIPTPPSRPARVASPPRTTIPTEDSETETEARYANRIAVSLRDTSPVRIAPPGVPTGGHVPTRDITRRPIDERYHQVTDLDLVVARLSEAEWINGSGYDTLLRVSEVIGPAMPEIPDGDLPYLPFYSKQPPLPAPLHGQVSIERRRVTKDGRVKVKMVLLDTAVDKCGICLTQFKERDLAVISPCRHTFHEACMKQWMVRSKTCPMCRTPMGELNY
ncbi:hypothetical protein VNI00_003589 [Paramarasmius palmivorus]|uniref:RING-type domain-containing protein n=1 Tax=Paramarasmius palmivorus TaxID=297713 RepID=A0AAW0DSU8_9AGAR